MIPELILVASLIGPLQSPEPPPPAPGVLPWALPDYPDVPEADDETMPEMTLDDPVHSDDYDDKKSDLEAKKAAMLDPVDELIEAATTWLGGLADITGQGDVDTGINPIGAGSITAYAFVDGMGDALGTTFAVLRVWAQYHDSPSFTVLTWFAAAIGWFIFLNVAIFALKLIGPILRVLGMIRTLLFLIAMVAAA